MAYLIQYEAVHGKIHDFFLPFGSAGGEIALNHIEWYIYGNGVGKTGMGTPTLIQNVMKIEDCIMKIEDDVEKIQDHIMKIKDDVDS